MTDRTNAKSTSKSTTLVQGPLHESTELSQPPENTLTEPMASCTCMRLQPSMRGSLVPRNIYNSWPASSPRNVPGPCFQSIKFASWYPAFCMSGTRGLVQCSEIGPIHESLNRHQCLLSLLLPANFGACCNSKGGSANDSMAYSSGSTAVLERRRCGVASVHRGAEGTVAS